MVRRALRRHCPRCDGGAFLSYFGMHEHCPRCGLRFEREPGYWVGAVIINTTVSFGAFVLLFGGLALATWPDVPWTAVLVTTIVVNGSLPIVFYPQSKTLWLALELSWHPLEAVELEGALARASLPEWQAD